MQRLVSRALLALLTLAWAAGCASLPDRAPVPVEVAVPVAGDGPLDGLIAPTEARNPGRSAFRLVSEGEEAFVLRAHGARLAKRSLDVQTYIWHADLTGLFLAQQLLEAADRGVRVRLLLDDMDARAKNAGIAAMAAHPKISVRLFNPFASRSGFARQVGEVLRGFERINRRMHNKGWIADNRMALVGGRNIGDEYYGAGDGVNFVDLDFAMFGPVVRDASASFDRYWNSDSSYPIELLDRDAVTPEALEQLRARLRSHGVEFGSSRYAVALRSSDAVQRLVRGDLPVEWSAQYRFVADDPAKATMQEGGAQRAQVAAALAPVVRAARTEVTIISPYFVPGEATPVLAAAARSGTRVRILTNSLAANDVAAVHGGYSRYRRQLLEGGVQIWELKPTSGDKPSSLFGSSGASLHTKALAVDRKSLFVGSFNLDPRSTWLNCEQGVIVENAVLAAQFEDLFAVQAAGQRSWQVTMHDGSMRWSDGSASFASDPGASTWKRLQAWIVRILHLDPQL